VGAVTRNRDIRQHRTRQKKRRKRRLQELRQALQKGRTHQDRQRIAEELREKWKSAAA
jgi:hypothetical protein